MERMTHGGDIYTAGRETALDFSANTNPLGLPEAVREEFVRAVDACAVYPDPFCRTLRAKLAWHYSVEPQYILCGNGAADILYRLVYGLRPSHALLCSPTFSEYQEALEQVDCHCDFFALEEQAGFTVDDRILEAMRPGGMMFVCNPNNPTGLLTSPELLLRIADRACQQNTVLVVDECFLEWTDQPESRTMRKHIERYPNLVVLNAFTKLYAMAGLRLGYAFCANMDIMECAERAGQPWSVSAVAQRCGVAALDCREYVNRSLVMVREQREWLWRELERLGLLFWKGTANYILFACDLLDLDERLLEKGILIRSCRNVRGLGERFYRIAVRKPDENRRLIQAMTEVLWEKS